MTDANCLIQACTRTSIQTSQKRFCSPDSSKHDPNIRCAGELDYKALSELRVWVFAVPCDAIGLAAPNHNKFRC